MHPRVTRVTIVTQVTTWCIIYVFVLYFYMKCIDAVIVQFNMRKLKKHTIFVEIYFFDSLKAIRIPLTQCTHACVHYHINVYKKTNNFYVIFA